MKTTNNPGNGRTDEPPAQENTFAAAQSATPESESKKPGGKKSGSRKPLYALLVLCIAPVVASYAAYYWLQPDGRINYGQLLDPQVDVAKVQMVPQVLVAPLPGDKALPVALGKPQLLSSFKGKWVMVVASSGACTSDCQQRLFNMRQVRLTTGRERSRVERLWLLTDSIAPDPKLLAEHQGSWVSRIDPADLAASFPSDSGRAQDHIFLIDPLGHLMMRFPLKADPNRIKKDLGRLLKASRLG